MSVDEALAARRQMAFSLIPNHRGASRCQRCNMPWGAVPDAIGHTVEYDSGYGAFPLCVWCWPRTSPEERVMHAAGLVWGSWARSMMPAKVAALWPQVERAFREAT